jgi:hypothetical protein
VTIGSVTVSDESLGELHKTGLAQEYEVNGTNSSIRSINWTDTAKSRTPISAVANDRDGGRMDERRDRSLVGVLSLQSKSKYTHYGKPTNHQTGL